MIDRLRGRVTRRNLLAGSVAGGGGLALGSGSGLMAPRPARAQRQTVRGGHLKQGIGGGSSADTLDPLRAVNAVANNITFQLRNCLVEINSDGVATGELAESWEARPGAQEWVFTLRPGVEFHSGKSLTVEDVIYSLNLHRGPQSRSTIKALLAQITDIRKDSDRRIVIALTSANADFPYILSDYHAQIVPDGTTDFAQGNGTGAFLLEAFEPGVRALTVRNPNYWNPHRGHVDSVETLVINDDAARTSALQTGEVHLINHVDRTTADLLQRLPNVRVFRAPSGQHYIFGMNTTVPPFDDEEMRLALKHAINRQQILDNVLHGYGSLGNDHPVNPSSHFFDPSLPQRTFDPDRARFHANRAGYNGAPIELHVADVAFRGAVDAGIIYRQSAEIAGLDLVIRRAPSDGYFVNVWMQAPFVASFWAARPTVDMMLSTAYASDAVWNETFWRRPDFDRLLVEARGALNMDRRRALYFELQRMIHEDGGAIIPVFADVLDAARDVVQGFEPLPSVALSGHRAAEKVWLQN